MLSHQGVALLLKYQEVCPCWDRCDLQKDVYLFHVWESTLRFQKPKRPSVTLFLLPANSDVELLAPSQHRVFLYAIILSAMTIMDGTSDTVSQPLLNAFLYKSCLGHGVSSQQWKPQLRQHVQF